MWALETNKIAKGPSVPRLEILMRVRAYLHSPCNTTSLFSYTGSPPQPVKYTASTHASCQEGQLVMSAPDDSRLAPTLTRRRSSAKHLVQLQLGVTSSPVPRI